MDLTPLRVFGEEVLESLPREEGRAVVLEDDVLKLIGDGGVDPEDDVDVGGAPLVVGEVGVGLLLDVGAGVVLGEDEEEEIAPLVVVAERSVELKLDVPGDVDSIDSGGEGRSWTEVLVGGAGAARSSSAIGDL